MTNTIIIKESELNKIIKENIFSLLTENLEVYEKYNHWLKNMAKTIYGHIQQFKRYSFDEPINFTLNLDNVPVNVILYPLFDAYKTGTSWYSPKSDKITLNVHTEMSFNDIYETLAHEMTHHINHNNHKGNFGASYYNGNFVDRINNSQKTMFPIEDKYGLSDMIDWILYHLWSRNERTAYRTKSLQGDWKEASSRLKNLQDCINKLNQDYNGEDLPLYKELENAMFNARFSQDRDWKGRLTRGKTGHYAEDGLLTNKGDKKRNAWWTNKHYELVKRNFIKKSQDLINKEMEKLRRNWYKYNN